MRCAAASLSASLTCPRQTYAVGRSRATVIGSAGWTPAPERRPRGRRYAIGCRTRARFDLLYPGDPGAVAVRRTGQRSRPEPPLSYPSRYPYADRHAAALAGMNMPDEVLYTMYEMAAEGDAIDLDALFAEDSKRWRALDRRTDLKLADFMESRNRIDPPVHGTERHRPRSAAGDRGPIMSQCARLCRGRSGSVRAELDFLLEGYAGSRQNSGPQTRRRSFQTVLVVARG